MECNFKELLGDDSFVCLLKSHSSEMCDGESKCILHIKKESCEKPIKTVVENVCSVCGATAKIKVIGKDIWYCDNCIN